MVLLPSLLLANPAAVAANKLRDVTSSCYPVQGLWPLIKQISYCCVSTSNIKFLVKILCLCFSLSFEGVLGLSMLPSDGSSNSLSLRPLGVDTENICSSQDAVTKQWGIRWKSINYALIHNLCIETSSFYEAAKVAKLLNMLKSPLRSYVAPTIHIKIPIFST